VTTTTSTSLPPGVTTTTSTSLPPGVTTTTSTSLPPGATIPAAGNWGMVILGLAFLGAIAWMVRARRSLR
jgi:LPXTG-motif cell wall-anchored protein